jgi:hypothetical protein
MKSMIYRRALRLISRHSDLYVPTMYRRPVNLPVWRLSIPSRMPTRQYVRRGWAKVVLSPFLFRPYDITLKPPAVDLRDTIFAAGEKRDPHLPKRNLLAPSGLVPGEFDEFLGG